jgi:hypothetical protein
MGNQLLPLEAVDCCVNDARSSSEPKGSPLDEQHANRRGPENSIEMEVVNASEPFGEREMVTK